MENELNNVVQRTPYNVQRTKIQDSGRLVCLTMDYPPMHGGVARYLFEMKDASHGRFEVWVPKEHPRAEERWKDGKLEGGEGFKRVKFWWGGWPKWLPLVRRCLEVGKGDAIFVSHVFPVGTAACVASFFGGPDYCVLFHGTDLARVRTRWKRWLLNRIAKRAVHLFTNSQATAKALRRLVSDVEPTIITPGVHQFVGPDKQTARKELDVAEDSLVVLSICRLVERKGIDVLIEAASRVESRISAPEAHPPWVENLESRTGASKFEIQRSGNSRFELVVVGNGPYSEPLHKLAELMRVNVRWVKDASDEDVKKWYAAADVFCLPAREQADDVEGFGIVFLEAAAAGLPVIAGKGWGTGEAVADGVTGLLVEPTADNVADAIDRLAGDEGLRKRLGLAGQERAARDFHWSDRWMTIEKVLGFESAVRSEAHNGQLDDVAVIIPCHNNADELANTLEALAQQTLKPHEVVVVDNLSDDKPENVVNRFLSRLPIRCVRYEKERGAPVARNYGFHLTQAPYVLFLDADTVLVPSALEKMRKALAENTSATFAYSNFYWGRVLFRGKPWDGKELTKINFIHTSALVKREALESVKNGDGQGPFDPALKKFQDWDLWLTLSENGRSGVWINEVLFSVTQQKNGMSHWLPSFVHRMPWPILGWMPREVKRYREARDVIFKKHGIQEDVSRKP